MKNGLLAAGSGLGSAWQRKRGRCRALAVATTLLLLASPALAQSTYTTRYTYDADGNRTSVTYPSGNVVTYSFDYADRPYSASSGASTLVSSAAYLPFGPETQIAYGNGTTKTMLYDSRYRVQQNKLTGPAGVIAQYDYQEDAAGNITQIHDATDPGFNRDFAYDDLQRLATANSGASLWGAGSYSYDAMGNMLSTSVTPAKTFSYDGTTPKLLAVATAGVSHSLSYDAVGNETGYIANRTYSSRNQLLSVSDSSPAGHTIAYGYDGRGIRVTRSESPVGGTGTARAVFTYSPELHLLGVTRDDAPNYDIEWFDGQPVAQSGGGTPLRYTLTDHLGTPILQTDAAGAVIWRAEYEPYGDVRQMRVGTSVDQPLRLPGQEVAITSEGGEESYNIFRWYRAGWGRYSQPDQDERMFDENSYAYAYDSPVGIVDPLGLYACTYHISAHMMTCVPKDPKHAPFSSSDYVSGNNDNNSCTTCQNNPNKINVRHGPLPTGLYSVGARKAGHPHKRPLQPAKGNIMYNRDVFQTHGCPNPDTCSEGCIAATRNATRDLFDKLMDEESPNTITVVP